MKATGLVDFASKATDVTFAGSSMDELASQGLEVRFVDDQIYYRAGAGPWQRVTGHIVSFGSASDPTRGLRFLEANAASVRRLQVTRLDGVRVTEYSATLPLRSTKGTGLNPKVPVLAWIDDEGVARQVQLDLFQNAGPPESPTIDSTLSGEVDAPGTRI
jgi:hypothetical protein